MTGFIKPVLLLNNLTNGMPNKLSDAKQRISSSLEKKLVKRMQKLADMEGITLTEVLKRAIEKLVADYEREKKSK